MSADLQSDDRTNQRLLEAFDAEHGCAFFTKPVVKRFLDDVSKELQYHQSEPTSNQLHDVDSKSSRDKRKTLVLDLDETLITSTKELPQGEGLHAPEQTPGLLNYMHQNNKRLTGEKPELLLESLCPGEDWSSPRGLYVFKRPGLDKFLQEVTLLYNVAIFTAASPEYADPILDALEKTVPRASHAADDTDNSALFSRRLYRDDMRYPGEGDPRRLGGGGKIKDLAILGKPLQDVVMVDDIPGRVVQIKNTIPIDYWSAATYMLHDQELLDLLPILRKLAVVDDVRDMWPQVLENDLPAVDDDLPADASADMPTTNMVDYSANTVVQLRDVLRSRGLTLGGKKAELVARLQDDDSTPANAPASTRY
jgi:Dullard-like phosphatase family protein